METIKKKSFKKEMSFDFCILSNLNPPDEEFRQFLEKQIISHTVSARLSYEWG